MRLFDAVLVLLKAELPEEAAIVARSLFEESLRLQQLAADETDRDALILGWTNESISERMGLLQLAKSLGLDDDINEAEQMLVAQRSDLQAYQKRRQIKRLRKFAGHKEAAIRFERQSDYWAYSFSHEFVHGSDIAWSYARRVVSDVAGLHARTDDPATRARFAEFAASSVTAATLAAGAMFDWLKVESVTETLKTLRELLAMDGPTSSGKTTA